MSTTEAPETKQLGAMSAKAARQAVNALKRQSRKPTWAVFVLLGIGIVTVISIFALKSVGREAVGGAAVVLMLVLLFYRVPIAFTLIVPALLGMLSLQGTRALETVLTSVPYGALAVWQLTTLPMFILMGMLLASSGIAERLYDTARLWIGWLPGGLPVATNIAGAGMAAVSGSTLGTAYSLGRIGIPQMLRFGYDRRLAVGSVISASLPGQVIPPSTMLIFIAGITGAAVGPQLIAGIAPGIGMVAIMVVLMILYSIIFPSWSGRSKEQKETNRKAAEGAPPITWRQRIVSLGAVWPLVVLILAVFGLMYGGVLTATEAGAAGAATAIVLTLWFRRKDKPLMHILDGARNAVSTLGAIFLVLIGAQMLTLFVAVTRLGSLFSNFVLGLGLDRVGFLLVVMVIYFLLGTFMESLPILLLTLPILQPVFAPLGIDLLWFGVFAVLMAEMAMLSPPVGILTFLVHGMVQNKEINLGQKITLNDVYTSVWMLMPGMFLLLILMILWPDWVLFLPNNMQG